MGNSVVYDSFGKFEKAILKGKLVFDMGSGSDRVSRFSPISSGMEIQRIQVYQFDGVTIVKEGHKERGTTSRRVTGWPECRYEHYPYSKKWAKYYVFKGNSLVSKNREAQEIIQKVTGVKLPDVNARIYNSIVTEISLDKKPERISPLDEQPDEKDIGREAYHIKKTLESIPKEFGLDNLEQVLPHVNKIITMASELSKDYEEKHLEEDEKRGRVLLSLVRKIS